MSHQAFALDALPQSWHGAWVAAVLIKKYGNRRLYDTGDSRYVTLDEIALKIRLGTDIRVIDAKAGTDLTQETLVQILLEGPSARLLPAPLLMQFVRLGDDAFAEFFSRYVTGALELYLQAKRGISVLPGMGALGAVGGPLAQAMGRMWGSFPIGPFAGMGGMGGPGMGGYGNAYAEPGYAAAPEPEPPGAPGRAAKGRGDADEQLAALRREVDELKQNMKADTRRPAAALGAPGAKRRRKT